MGVFHFSARSSTFLTAFLLSVFMSTESNWSETWTDRFGQRPQSPVAIFRRKTESINVYTFWFSLQISRSNSKLYHLDQGRESHINLSKKKNMLPKQWHTMVDLKMYPLPLNWFPANICLGEDVLKTSSV